MDGIRDRLGAEAVISWEHSLIHSGKMFQVSEYDTDTDIIAPKQISILPVGQNQHIIFSVSASASCKVQLVEGVAIGTGGSAAAGTAMVPTNRDRASLGLSSAVVHKDYVLGSSGQAAGTEIDAIYLPGVARSAQEWILKAGTLYGLIITAIADNTVLSWSVDLYED